MIYLSPIKQDERKTMTTFQLKPGHTQAIAEVNEKQWIEGSKMHNSDEDSDDEKVKDVVDKLTEE